MTDRPSVHIEPPEGRSIKDVCLYDDEYGYLHRIVIICDDYSVWARFTGEKETWEKII